MKSDRNLFEILSTKGTEINKKLSEFFRIIENKREVLDGFTVIGQSKSSRISIHWDTKNASVNAFYVKVSGEYMKEDYERSNGFLGLGKLEYKKVFKRSRMSDLTLFPFIQTMFYASEYNPKYPILNDNIYTDLNEFVSKINSLNIIEFDNDAFGKIVNFIQSIINDVLKQITSINESLTNELTSFINVHEDKVIIVDSSDLMKLLTLKQQDIINIDKEYLHKFVRLSNYLKQRGKNIQTVYEAIINENSISDKKELIGILRNQIHNYELVLFHSLNMVASLCSGNLIEFYEIYESFDKLNIFNSNWENEVSEKLLNIGEKLSELMYSIYSMEQNIVSELNQLSYITSESFNQISTVVNSQLNEIKSSLNTNTLLNGIQAYQLYKINRNTKSLRD